jgi:hypothetical protein
MNAIRGAILAGLCPCLWAATEGPLPEPLHVRFHLADGVQVSGEWTLWDRAGIDGTFGRREWEELATDDIWRLYRRVMDPDVADQWIDLGRLLLIIPDGAARAERAFGRALRLSPENQEAIDAARAEAARVIEERKQRREEAAAHRLRTRTPESGVFGAAPWPTLSEREHEQALDAVKIEAAEILRSAGLSLIQLETPDFVVYSDLERLDAARWAVALDGIARRLKVMFGLGEIERVFWGKAVVFLFREQDRFALMEADAFGQLVPRKAMAICHPRGERVFISAYRVDDDEALLGALVHHTVHGFMHRYRSAMRLPPWANEGVAEYVAALTLPEASRTLERRRDALAFIRGGGDLAGLLAARYEDESWPERDEQAEAVGALLVELMITEKPRRFVAWVDAVKADTDWREALAGDFGTLPRQFLETALQYYRVND